MLSKEKMGMIVAEFIGTALLTSIVLVVANMFGTGTATWYVALSAGVTLAVIVGMFGRVSGAHVNPAVTIGLWSQKQVETTNAIVYVATQLLGGAVALSFYNYMTGGEVLAAGSSTFIWSVFWAELVGAAVFGMGIAAAVSQKLEGYFAAFTIGMSLTMGALIASVATAGSTIASSGFLNPAVALGNNAWDKTLVIAPIMGMVIGMFVYMAYLAPATAPVAKKRKK